MKFGVAMFFTDYAMGAADFARAVEDRGFESIWAPEHSHIPLSRESAFRPAGNCQRNTPIAWIRSYRCPSRRR